MSLGNLNRLRAKKLVSLFPGIHLRMLQRMAKTSFSTTRYHVRNLELAGEIVCAKGRGHDRLYPAGLSEREMAIRTLILDRKTRAIMERLLESGTMGNGEISEATNVAKSTVSEHIDALRMVGVVHRSVALDGTVSFELRDREEVARLLESFRASILASAADRFIDLWDI